MGSTKKVEGNKSSTFEAMYEHLLEMRTADKVILHFRDGRVLQGAVIFNSFKGTGRLINIDQEISVDFSPADLLSVIAVDTSVAACARSQEPVERGSAQVIRRDEAAPSESRPERLPFPMEPAEERDFWMPVTETLGRIELALNTVLARVQELEVARSAIVDRTNELLGKVR